MMNDSQRKNRLGTVSKNILLEGLNQFYDANLAINSDVDQDTFWKVTKRKKNNTHDSQEVRSFPTGDHKATRNSHDSTANTNMKHNKQKRSTKESPPWNGQRNIHRRA